jgi:protein TonB
MHNNFYRPSKIVLTLCLAISAILHFFVCKIPVESKMPEEETINKISFSIVSLAREAVIAQNQNIEKEQEEIIKEVFKAEPKKIVKPKKINKQVVKEVQKVEPKKKEVKKQEIVKKEVFKKKLKKQRQSVISSNNKGQQFSTVIPTLSDDDLIKTVAPKYPRRSVRLGQQGVVLVKVKLQNGKAVEYNLGKSSGYSSLDKSALKAVKKWKFKNTALSKVSESQWVQIPVEFVIR